MIRYSINTNCLKDKMTISEIANLAARLNYDGIEWGLPAENYKSAAKEMAKATAARNLKISGFLNAGHLWKEDLMRSYSEAVADTGGSYIRVSPPWFAHDYNESMHQRQGFDELFKLCRKGLEMLGKIGAEYKIKYVMETHMGSLCASPALARMLLEGLNPEYVGIIYDPANGIWEGFYRPRLAVEMMGRYLSSIHAKNLLSVFNGINSQFGPPRAHWGYNVCPLSDGCVDWSEVFFAAKLSNFDGWIAMEEYFVDAPEEQLRQGLDFLKKCEIIAITKPIEPFTEFNS